MFKKFFKKFINDDNDEKQKKETLNEEEKVKEEEVDEKFFDEDINHKDREKQEDDIELNYHEQLEDEITQEEMDEIDFSEVIEEAEEESENPEIDNAIELDYHEETENEISQEEMDEMNIEEMISEETDEDHQENIPTEVKEDTKVDEEVKEEKKVPEKKSFFERLKSGLFKTRDAMNSAIDNLINGKAKIDDDLYDELEEIMISADMGVETTISTIDELRDVVADNHIRDPKLIKVELEKLLRNKLKANNQDNSLNVEEGKQSVILVIGVNGVGKTTTIGKLAYNLKKDGKSVMIAAGDTFRAAAIEQLGEWAKRVDAPMISTSEGSDPASVVFDAIKSQKANNTDVLIIDTAGRLHNKVNLMNELEKINRIISREHPDANKEILLVLDATTGQNALFQAKEFNKVTKITGLVLTKLDGTAKGGVVFPLQVENNIPVKFIGIGEQKDNLEKFDSDKFVDALFSK